MLPYVRIYNYKVVFSMNLLENDIFNGDDKIRRISKEAYQKILDSRRDLDLISLAYHARYYNRDYKKVLNGYDENLKAIFQNKYTSVNPYDILKIFLEDKNVKGLWMVCGRYPKFYKEVYINVKESDDEDYKLEFIRWFDKNMEFLESVNIPPKLFWNVIVKKKRLSSSNIIGYMLRKYDPVILFMYLYRMNMISSPLQYEELLRLIKTRKEDFIEIDEFFYNKYLKDLAQDYWVTSQNRISKEHLYNDYEQESLSFSYECKKQDQVTFDEVLVKK